MIRKITLKFDVHAISKDNEKFTNKQGIPFTSTKFKDFERDLKFLANAQLPLDFKRFETEDLCVSLTYTFKNKKHCDTFNLPKSTCDAMNGILWKDDRQIKSGAIDINYGKEESILLEVSSL